MKKILFLMGCFIATLNLQAQEKVSAEDIIKVKDQPASQLLDVRTAKEFAEGHIQNAQNIDWTKKESFQASVEKLDKSKPVYVYCLGGGRSKQAAAYLAERGYQVFEYNGGMMDWRSADRPEIKDSKASESEDTNKEMTTAQFDALTKSADLVLINYSAVWCGPCQELKPALLKIQKEQTNLVKVVRIDADQNKTLMKSKKITAIPLMTLYKDGKEVWKHTGVLSEAQIMAQINKYAKK